MENLSQPIEIKDRVDNIRISLSRIQEICKREVFKAVMWRVDRLLLSGGVDLDFEDFDLEFTSELETVFEKVEKILSRVGNACTKARENPPVQKIDEPRNRTPFRLSHPRSAPFWMLQTPALPSVQATYREPRARITIPGGFHSIDRGTGRRGRPSGDYFKIDE